MCVIKILLPNQMPKKEQLMNAVYNNWHSFGLVIRNQNPKKGEKPFELIRQVPQKEVDWKEVYDLLHDNINAERILHLRHNTAGATTLENCHPFKVFDDGKESVWFMHNGTLHSYKSRKPGTTYVNGQQSYVDDPDGPSDTQNFANEELAPMLNSDFGTGKADIQNPRFMRILNKFWATNNRGILIPSDPKKSWKLIDVALNPWKKIKGEGDVEFISSNDDYYDKVIRGPEFERREERRKQELEQSKTKHTNTNPASSQSSNNNIISLSGWSNRNRGIFDKAFDLSKLPSEITNDWQVWARETAVSLGYLTSKEIDILFEKTDEATLRMLTEATFTDYALLYEQYEKLEEKLRRASAVIASLKGSGKTAVGALVEQLEMNNYPAEDEAVA